LGIEGFRKEKMEKAREKNVMEKMFFLMNGNKKGSAFMTWKQAVERAKNAEARQTIYNLTELSTKVDKHDRMFITFAKTFRLIPENVSEMMQAQSPKSKGAGGAEEGVPPRGA
jgi:aspartate/glutamate racemase